MALLSELKKRLRYAVGPVLGIGIFGYFAYHAIEGERGLFAYMRLQDRIAEAEQARLEVAAIRAEMERRVALLRPDHTDPDMLDERARLMLNLAQPDEVVVFNRRAAPRPAGALVEVPLAPPPKP
jgi:cell division protein FtsB